MYDFKNQPTPALDEQVPDEQPNKEDKETYLIPLLLSHMYPYWKGMQSRTNSVKLG